MERRQFLLARQRRLREVTVQNTRRPITYYRARWEPNAKTPELEIPLQCPAVLPENIERWRRLWKEVGGVSVTGLAVSENPAEIEKAHAFNARVTQGRLVDFACEGEALGERIVRDLKLAIARRFTEHMNIEDRDGLRREMDQQERFLFISSEEFIEGDKDCAALDEYIENELTKLFIVTAPGGTGKSTLLANWVIRCQKRLQHSDDKSVHYRFIGASEKSTSVESLLRFLLMELKETYQAPFEIPDDPFKLPEFFYEVGGKIAEHRQLMIFVIDGVNHLDGGKSDLVWLPDVLPKNVKIIVSYKRDEQEPNTPADSPGIKWEVSPFLSNKNRYTLVEKYLSQYLKELDPQHLE